MQNSLASFQHFGEKIKFLVLENIDYIFLAAIFLVLIFIFWDTKIFRKNNSKNSFKDLENSTYFTKSQLLHKKKADLDKLNSKEKLKISWQFLTDIIEYVRNFFSKEDKDIVEKVGIIFKKNGVKYVHVVEAELNSAINKEKLYEHHKKGKERNL
ncbi:MAG: DUF2660 domain-containing protein [Rickettsia sp.]|nr:DUF2660 domain-containing protein [Rickettsia sp.]